MSAFYSQRGGLIRETKLPMQEFELKMQGGVIAGFYGNINDHASMPVINISFMQI